MANQKTLATPTPESIAFAQAFDADATSHVDPGVATILHQLLVGIAGPIEEGRIDPTSYFEPGMLGKAVAMLKELDESLYRDVAPYFEEIQ